MRSRGLPVLAFRLDRVLSASNTTDLGLRLDLEESPVLTLVAAAEAAASPGFLIVDQLDAVSSVSGRVSGAFDLVERLLHEARGTRLRATIHTIVVCRAFDWKNDSRLRKLIPDTQAQVDVTEFPVDEVRNILAHANYDPELFQERQLELLQLPQNLSLFVEAGFDPATAPTFRTATELFDRYWDEKRQRIEARAELSGNHWMEVVEILCDEMTFTQELSVPKEKLDRTPIGHLNLLASEGVITYDGYRCGFGHESFFDYCFARLFLTRSESLVSFLLESEQHLFRRAQVRQVLVYLRDRDFARYVKEVRNLLADERVRIHIKDLVFALLAEVTHPTEEEWTIWENWMTPALKAIDAGTPNPDKLSAVAWQRFFGSTSWFDFADEHGMIEAWLTSGSNRLIDEIVNYLRAHHRHSPDRVSALLEPYANGQVEWQQRSNFFMEWAELHTSRRLFDLFLRLLDNGTLDEPRTGNSSFWSMLHNLGENRPEWIPEVIAHQFRRRLAVIRAADESIGPNMFVGYDQMAVKTFHASAARAPAPFVEHVLPILLEISDSALQDEAPPKRDAVWLMLVSGDELRGEYACLSALAKALATLARDGNNLASVIAELRSRDTHVSNHLLLSLYHGGAEHYADAAVSLLCDEPWRFQCGYSDSPNWCSMKLIRAVAPRCHTSNLERLETVILGYTSPFERTKSGYKLAGLSRFSLLSAIPSELRSAPTNRHFQELKRKFRQPIGEPRKMIAEMVSSPIEKTAANRMTDDQWLLAMAKYREDNFVSKLEDHLRGGAYQLAQVLNDRVKEEPERFARLSLRIPADTNPLYLAQILSALEKATIPEGLKLQVCRRAFAGFRDHCGRSIADVLGNMANPLPGDAIQMLHYLATEHEDPDTERWKEIAGGGQPYYGGDIYTNGINTTRGRAVEAIRDLISKDARYIDRFHATLERIICDKKTAVLSCVAGTLRAVALRSPVVATALFRRMALPEDRLLATPHVYGFIHTYLHDHFHELRSILVRMLRSSEPEVCEAGARLAGIAALIHREASDLADEALGGNARNRLGIAQVAVTNIQYADCRAWSKRTLTKLFDDEDSDVRREAANCFRHMEDDKFDTYDDLITAFCHSRAFQENLFWLFHKLENMRERLPGTTCLVCEKYLDRFADDDNDMETRRFGDTRNVAKLIFRTYQQHQDDEWTSRLLDLIDRLCLERIFDARREFEQFER